MNGYEVLIVSPYDRENVVYEIWRDKVCLAEVRHEPGEPVMIEFEFTNGMKPPALELQGFIEILQDAMHYFSK